jgi:hypothetical protein
LSPVRKRFWFEAVMALVSLICCVVTVLVPTWIETVLGVDPDGGNGAMEWTVVVLATAVTFAASAAAYREVRAAASRA